MVKPNGMTVGSPSRPACRPRLAQRGDRLCRSRARRSGSSRRRTRRCARTASGRRWPPMSTRRPRSLDRLRPRPRRRELDVLARRSDASSSAHSRCIASTRSRTIARRSSGVDAVVGHLVHVPAEADAEAEASAGEEVERRDLLGGDDRVALGDEQRCRCRPAGSWWRAAAAVRATNGSRVRLVLLGQVAAGGRGRDAGWSGCACARASRATRGRAPRRARRARRCRIDRSVTNIVTPSPCSGTVPTDLTTVEPGTVAPMPGICEGRVVIVTGAGRGLGRGHALELARQGARVVVNDLGAELDGTGRPTAGPAAEVVAEIEAIGGEAVVNGDDVADWDGAERLVAAGDRRLRPARRRGQQRRLRARPHVRRRHRGRVGRGHAGAPQGPLRAEPLRGAALARPGQGGRGRSTPASSTPPRAPG